MSVFDTINPAAEEGATGTVAFTRTAGFFEAFNLAYEQHVRGMSMSGLQHAFEEQDELQAQEWGSRVDGGKAPRLRDIGDFEDIAEYLVTGQGLDPDQITALEDYDKAVEKSKAKGTGLYTSRELFASVQELAQKAERDAGLTPTTIGGDIGAFAGGTIAAFDPRTDFWNFATLPVGAAGKTILARIMTQSGAQGFIETINQITGVQQNRELLGLEHGFTHGALQVATTAAGAGVLQGLGEGAVVLGRRWFGSPSRSTRAGEAPNPALEEAPAPPPRVPEGERPLRATDYDTAFAAYRREVVEASPWRGPTGAVRTEEDLRLATAQLSDWTGVRPWELQVGRTTTAIGRVISAAERREQPLDIQITKDAPLDTMAREYDPATFAVYDDLASRKAQLQALLDQTQPERAAQAQEAVADLQDEITRLRGRLVGANKRQTKKLEDRIAKLEQERDTKVDRITRQDTPTQAQARRRLMQIDEQMRSMAPVISRAYARARGQWNATENELNGVVGMIRNANTRRLEAEVNNVDVGPIENPAPTPIAMHMSKYPDILAERKPNDSAADAMDKIMETELEVTRQGIDQFRAASVAFKPEGDTVRLEGYDYEFNLDNDKIAVPNEDGEGFTEVTVRQMIEETRRDEAELQAVTACSTRPVS